jgi:hypothetical protein
MYTEKGTTRTPHRFDGLRRVVAGRVHVPGDAGWDEVRRPWNVAAAIAGAFGRLEARLRDHTSGRTVPNFMGAGNDLDQIWPAGVREKLAEIKRRVDPVHTIRSNRPVL